MEIVNVKVGDIIDGRRVTKVFELCGGIAYQSEPVGKDTYIPRDLGRAKIEKVIEPEPIEEEKSEEKPKRGRRKKEA